MASKTITALKTDNNNLITTNGAREITGAILNGFIEDILDSCVNRISDVSILGLFDFDSSQTYLTGQAVIYNDGGGDQIYRANKDNGPSAFNPLEWDAISSTDTNIGNSDLTLTANRTLGGAFNLVVNVTGGSSQFTQNNRGLYATGSETKLLAGSVAIEVNQSSGVRVLDGNGTGVRYSNYLVDEASIVWATDLNHIPSIGAISSHIGLQDVNALVTTPTATEDGYAIVWDNTAGEYQLQSAGTAITSNRVAIGTGTDIQDSLLSTTNVGDAVTLTWIPSNTDITSLTLTGSGGESANNFIRIESEDNIHNIHPDQSIFVQAESTYLEVRQNKETGTVAQDFLRLKLGQSLTSKVDLYNFGGIDTAGAPVSWFTAYGDVDYMGHKFGPSSDPRVQTTNTDNYSWLSDNLQHFLVGGLPSGNTSTKGALNGFNAHLIVSSISGSTNPRPHFMLTGGYDETGTAPSNNSGWLSSNDNVWYWKDNNGVSIPMRGLKSVISNSQASTATLTPNANSEDIEIVTALAGALTIASPTGTPVEGQKLVIKIKDDGTSRALTWNAIFQVIGTTLPTATTISKWHRIECEYNVTDTKWDVISVLTQA